LPVRFNEEGEYESEEDQKEESFEERP